MADQDAIEAANRQRDRRRRRCILRRLHNARVAPMGGLHGDRLLDLVDDSLSPGDRIDGDSDVFLGLVRDLVAGGYAKEEDTRSRKNQRWSIEWLLISILGKGTALVEEAIAPDPMIEDDRLPGAA